MLEGKGVINGIGIEKGMHFIIPMEYGICEMKGIFSILCSWVPKPQLLQERKPLPENRGEQSLRQKMEISVYDWMGRRKAGETDGEQVILAFEDIYEEGDTIRLSDCIRAITMWSELTIPWMNLSSMSPSLI